MFQHLCSDTASTLSGLSNSTNNLAVLTARDLLLLSIDVGGEEEMTDGSVVRITGAGGGGYNVKTSRHRLTGRLAAGDKLPDGLSNLVWFGDKIFASVDFPDPAVVVFKVR